MSDCDCPCCRARQNRRALFSQEPERPRCIECSGDIVFGVKIAELDERLEEVTSGIYQKGDLLCFWCSEGLTHEVGRPSVWSHGHA